VKWYGFSQIISHFNLLFFHIFHIISQFFSHFQYLFTFQLWFLPYFDEWKKGRLNSGKIWKIWNKGKLNSEMIWKIGKKSKLNSEMLWKIQKKIVKRYGISHFQYLFTFQLWFLPYFDESLQCCDIRHGPLNYHCLFCFVFSFISPFLCFPCCSR
jgi:hypothetical protein